MVACCVLRAACCFYACACVACCVMQYTPQQYTTQHAFTTYLYVGGGNDPPYACPLLCPNTFSNDASTCCPLSKSSLYSSYSTVLGVRYLSSVKREVKREKDELPLSLLFVASPKMLLFLATPEACMKSTKPLSLCI